jgi:hypothetical protein
MLYPDLANSAAARIRADLLAARIPITPATETYLAAISSRTRCWKGVFAAAATWIATASPAEQYTSWQAIIKVCDQDQRPLAAMSRLYACRNSAQALKTLWQSMPVGTLPTLQVSLAANPLLLAMFKDPRSGVVGLPPELADPDTAAKIWVRVQAKMEKLSQFDTFGAT